MVTKLLGKKVGMTRMFLEEGRSVPVTVLKVGPCVVTQKKTSEKEGYDALQIGYEPCKEKRLNKPLRGHFMASGKGGFAHLREIGVENTQAFELGQEIKSDIFAPGDNVHVSGKTKGRGFTGVVKRWGFGGGKKTHGSRSHRVPGAIGSCTFPGRVQKGKKLPGRMGHQRKTIKNLMVVDVRPDMDIVLVKGSVPGSNNTLIEISKG